MKVNMKEIRIGSRDTPLALWQAREVARHLQNHNYRTEIVTVKPTDDGGLAYSDEDKKNLIQNLIAGLRSGNIDVAVHSLKDVPTVLPESIEIIACLKRNYAEDVLVRSPHSAGLALRELKVATDDPRRRAFWLKEFPEAEFATIRGNANTRLKKTENSEVDAGIFSLARLKRLNLNPAYEVLPFICPAPAQGIVTVLGRSDNQGVNVLFSHMNDADAAYCAAGERAFQNVFSQVNGFAVGAFSEIEGADLRFRGAVCSFDGKNCIETDDIFKVDPSRNYGKEMAEQILKNGGSDLFENSVLH